MKKGDRLENIVVEKMVFGGKGFARIEADIDSGKKGRVLFITGGAIPGSVVNLKVVKKKKDYAECQITDVITKSPLEQEHPNNPYGMTGGCKWVNIPYEEQLKIKSQQVEESLFHLKKYQENINVDKIIPSPLIDGYRNKVEFSFGKYISHKEEIFKHFEMGFHKQGSFSQIQDVDGCILIDQIQNDIYLEIKTFCKTLGLPVYDQKTHQGFFRHLMVRRTFFADEIMLLLSFNHLYEFEGDLSEKLSLLKKFFGELQKKYPIITSIYFSNNTNKADVCIGDLELVHGKSSINEELLGLTFENFTSKFFPN